VNSGQKAIDLVRAGDVKYNAIFMDHMMPGMDGIEAVRIIRNDIGTDYAKTVPIIALTANAIIGNEELFLQNGFQAFLSKPIDIMRMNEAINHWVRDKELEKSLPQHTHEQRVSPAVLNKLAGKEVQGVDFSRALERFGDEDSYLETLSSYVTYTPSLLDKIRNFGTQTESSAFPPDLPSEIQFGEYATTVHGIKGSSYGICADEAGKQAEDLEHAAHAKELEFIQAQNASFIVQTEKLIQDLAELLAQLDERNQKPRKPAPDAEILEKIRSAAADFDMREADRLMKALEEYSYESQDDLVLWLRDQINQSNFDEIEKRLEEYR
jgi:CheY-like chemotaxis protein